MKIVLKCFSQVKYALDTDEMTFDLEDGQTASDLEHIIRKRAGSKLEGVALQIAINQEFRDGSTVLRNGDEVAFIPPVQGG
tara:strand:+ start:1138 stop:1380 length:243 start_codon:yes stop_codon:yes gene_type:complete